MIIKYARSVNDIINEVGLLNASNIAYSYSIAIKVKDAMKIKNCVGQKMISMNYDNTLFVMNKNIWFITIFLRKS